MNLDIPVMDTLWWVFQCKMNQYKEFGLRIVYEHPNPSPMKCTTYMTISVRIGNREKEPTIFLSGFQLSTFPYTVPSAWNVFTSLHTLMVFFSGFRAWLRIHVSCKDLFGYFFSWVVLASRWFHTAINIKLDWNCLLSRCVSGKTVTRYFLLCLWIYA